MPLPNTYIAPNDLTDAEFAELDRLLIEAPAHLFLGDAVMLDGYLCGVLVQPRLVDQQEWLPRVFEIDDGSDDDVIDIASADADHTSDASDANERDDDLPPPIGPQIEDAEWRSVVTPLIVRRHAALNRSIVEQGSFDPFILSFDEDDEGEAITPADADPSPEADDELAALNPVSRALAPWVFGFQLACVHFGGLLSTSDDAAMLSLARLFRHLPPADEQMAELIATMDKESPIETLDEGIDELVACVIDLSDLMSNERYHVETVRREQPKVGRNDPCPCGSGRKFKQCHGAA